MKRLLKNSLCAILVACSIMYVYDTVVFFMEVVGVSKIEIVDGVRWHYVVKEGKAIICCEKQQKRVRKQAAIPKNTKGALVVPSRLGGKEVVEISEYSFKGCTNITSVVIPGCVKHIGYRAFEKCESLAEVVISNGVGSISFHAFQDCPKLCKVEIPKSVWRISGNVFSGCTNLYDIIIDKENKDYSSKNGVLYDKGDGEILRLPPKNGSVVIPADAEVIDGDAFEDNIVFSKIIVEQGNKRYSVRNGMLYDDKTDMIVRCPNTVEQVMLPSTAKIIGNRAFARCRNISSIVIPQSIKRMGVHVFYECEALERVVFEDGADDMVLKDSIFSGCSRLRTLELGNRNLLGTDYDSSSTYKTSMEYLFKGW